MTAAYTQITLADGLAYVAMPKRVVLQHRGGVPTIYYGHEVISFDTPSLEPLAQALADGAPFDPVALCPMAARGELEEALETLYDMGILAGSALPPPAQRLADAPALPQGAGLAMDWRNPSQVAQSLGLTLDPAHLELIVPIFRVAHPALDDDGRQVGEANVFPRALRLEAPTEWQLCTYAGTRHRDEKPMNLTALKAMRAHWPQMMALLAHIRTAYLGRAAITGPMTLGQLERLSIAVLALPTWHALQDAPLHPALSSLFRVTDGLRIVLHQMMFVPSAEPMLPPETIVTAEQIFDYAERSLSFHSDTGVCAGPQHFIAEFLSVMVDGALPRFGAGGVIEPQMLQALGELDAAFDYGFAALAAHAAAFSVWPAMAQAWAEIADLAQTWPANLSAQMDELRDQAAEAARRLEFASYLGRAEWRDMRRATYAEMQRAAAGLSRIKVPQDIPAQIISPDAALLAAALPGLPNPAQLAQILAEFSARAGADLACAAAIQNAINQTLNRPAVVRGFTLADMRIHGQMVADPHPRLQFLPDVLAQIAGLHLSIETQPIQFGSAPTSTTVDQPRKSA